MDFRFFAAAVLLLVAQAPAPARAEVQGERMETCLNDFDLKKEISRFHPKTPQCEFQSYSAITSWATSKAEEYCNEHCKRCSTDSLGNPHCTTDPSCLAACKPRKTVEYQKDALKECLADLTARQTANEEVLAAVRIAAKKEHDKIDLSGLANKDEKLAYYRQGNVLCQATKANIGMGPSEGTQGLASDAINRLSSPGGGGEKAFEYLQLFEGGFETVDQIIARGMDPRAVSKWGWSPSTVRIPPPTRGLLGSSDGAGTGTGISTGAAPGRCYPLGHNGEDKHCCPVRLGEEKHCKMLDQSGKLHIRANAIRRAMLAYADPACKTPKTLCDMPADHPGGPCRQVDPQTTTECSQWLRTQDQEERKLRAEAVRLNREAYALLGGPTVTLTPPSVSPPPTPTPPDPVPDEGRPGPVEGSRETFFKTLTDNDITQTEGAYGGSTREGGLAQIKGFTARDCRYQDCTGHGSGSASPSPPRAASAGGEQAASGSPGASGRGAGGTLLARVPGSASAEGGFRWFGLMRPGQDAAPGEDEEEVDGEEPDVARLAALLRLMDEARQALGKREWRNALDIYTKILELDPNDVDARTTRSIIYNILSRYIEAEQDARRAIELDPKNAKAWTSLAYALLRQGRYREAAEAATRAVELDPNNAFAYRVRAEAWEQLGDDTRKLADLARAAELDPARFGALYEAVKNGAKIAGDPLDPALLLLEQERTARRSAPPKAPSRLIWLLLALAATAAAVTAIALVLRRRRRRAAQADAPAPPAAVEVKQSPRVEKAVATPSAPPPPSPPVAASPGRFVGAYEVARALGDGGRTYVGADVSTGKTVLLRKPAVPAERLKEAARAAEGLASLRHPGIAGIVRSFVEGGELWLAEDLVAGSSLKDALARSGPLRPEAAIKLFTPILEALAFAHERGFVHGGLRPSCVLFAKDGSPRLAGFHVPGEARPPSELTLYDAPELVKSGPSRAGDVYSAAVCLHQALTGKPLPSDPAASRTTLDPAVERVFALALQPDPMKRLQTANDLLKALQLASPSAGGRRALASGPVSAADPTGAPAGSPRE